MTIRGLGINYDTGFFPGGKSSRPLFDPAAVRRDMGVIAQDLHCTAVRVSGGDPVRLSVAAAAAKAEGLEVWFTFATFGAVHSDDAAHDLDLGAYGLVKMIDDEHWKPKEGFHALAAEYAKRS
jgi:hypothetical protein